MKTVLFSLLLALFAIAKSSPGEELANKKGYVLSFHDEFGGSKLDKTKWIDSYPGGIRTHANNEQQYYSPSGYEVKNGQLKLIATDKHTNGMPYTSGMVCSYGKFSQRYGWFETRAKFPKGKGFWPAFWLLPASRKWPPEIDILEVVGHEPKSVFFTNHWGTDWKSHKYVGDHIYGTDYTADFHVFALEWTPKMLVWYVDGKECYRVTEHIEQDPMYVIANLAVGGDWPGTPDKTTIFPSAAEFDYIRVYKLGR